MATTPRGGEGLTLPGLVVLTGMGYGEWLAQWRVVGHPSGPSSRRDVDTEWRAG